MVLGDNDYVYDATRFFVTSIDLPLIAQILEASPSEPYVGMTLKLDRMQIAQLILDSQLPSLNSGKASRAIELGALSKPLFGAIERLIDLLAEPECIPVLSPLVQKEIVFRLLTTECGPKIRQIATGGSHIHQISRVIDWIKGNLSERLRVEDLAGRAGMSVSTLHHHFRSLTALSPLQFEKHLRLNEARRLMLIDRVDAATAAFQVGCESPSQFSREHSGGTSPSGGRGVEKRNGRKVPRVHGQRALRQGVIFRCFLPATQALEN